MEHQNRDNGLLSLRRETAVTGQASTGEEHFQNATLRPLLKLQNDLLIEVFRNYISKYKNEFYSYTAEKKMHYIENAVQKDIKFRNSLKGILIGMFTMEEYSRYIINSSRLNKRMMNLLIERIKNQIQLFEQPMP